MEHENSGVIFDLTRNDYNYRGILFAEMDNSSVSNEIGIPPPTDFIAGVIGIMWTDEKGMWHFKLRIKFPSGGKQISSLSFEKEFNEKININETYVLNKIYEIPMINKTWTKNPDGTPEGILKIIEDLEMIESKKILKNK